MRKTPARPHPAHWGRGRPESRKRERADHPLRPRGREGFPALRKNGDAGYRAADVSGERHGRQRI
jgi:hypothetical protein